jgi:hypothetical protein
MPDYWPLALESSWIYVERGRDIEIRVTGRRRINGFDVFAIEGGGVTRHVHVAEWGIEVYRADGRNWFGPLLAVRRSGDTWVEEWAEDRRLREMAVTSVGEELVEVPAGRFTALRVRAEEGPPGNRIVEEYWYAPGTGPVKTIVTSHRSGESPRTIVRELKKYVRGLKE